MERTDYTVEALFEHRFWLQILGDHGRFIFNSLSPKEGKEIQTAGYFIQVFDHLLKQSHQPLTGQALLSLTQQANACACGIRNFKLHIIRRHLKGNISIGLPPTFLNHMVNEVEEYLRILQFLLIGKVPPMSNPIHHHLLWLDDASGHASAITSDLDEVEQRLMKKSRAFTKHFDQFYHKAIELAGYMRSNVTRFPALSRFNRQVELEIHLFRKFLHELEEMELDAEVLGTFTPLMADHMAREECYYLMKLSQVSEVKKPQCDPTHHRVEGKSIAKLQGVTVENKESRTAP